MKSVNRPYMILASLAFLVALALLAVSCQGQATSTPNGNLTPSSVQNPTPTESDQHTHTATVTNASATLTSSTVVPGCQIQELTLGTAGSGADFQEPETLTAANGVLSTTLTVEYGDPTKNKIGDCPVHLRSYNGKLVGPTLRVRPGDTLRINLVNNLPVEDDHGHQLNTLGMYNDTNLHTHGLHVSPVGNSDNVLLDIGPGQTFGYEIKIPLNQVPGTYWYHAHMHGSTATQVSSGMAGAIVIMGDEIPNTADALPAVKEATEKVFVIEQIIYDEAGVIEPGPSGAGGTFPDAPAGTTYFGPCNWEPIKREHVINGQLFPTLMLAPGQVERWRLIDAGVRESIGVELHGPYTGSGNPATITETLALPTVNLNEIAVDGIALDQVNAWQQVELEPGYRSDVLVKVTEPGKYYLVDNGVLQTVVTQDSSGVYTTTTQTSDALTCPTNPEQPGYLATVVVSGTSQDMSLPTDAEWAKLPPPLQPIVALTTTTTVSPFDDANFFIPLETIDGLQKVDFTVTGHLAIGNLPAGGVTFLAADHPFNPQSPRSLTLGNTEEWVLNTQEDSLYYAHPFHIHVNPFQTWRPGPDGKPQTVWRDTLLVRQGVPAYIFTRYQDYIGQFVYHCHILDHEDQGMMELLEIVTPPDPTATPASN
jgi:FtsP/CotA-like multicopper oxidase with cupredoxin domain